MNKLELILFNVGHGLSVALIEHPENYVTLIDLGANSDFSPLEYLAANRGLRPDFLLITHPHADHLSDIENALVSGMQPDFVYVQNYNWSDVKQKEREEKRYLIDRLQTLIASINLGTYGGKADLNYWAYSPKDAKELFGDSRYINNSSLFIIYNWKDFKIAIAGDLETEGVENFCGSMGFINSAKNSDILVAPHHGHNQGFYSGWPNKIGKPYISLISIQSKDGHFAKGYQSSDFAKGISFNSEVRYTMTTRRYGSIQVNMYYNNGKPTWTFNSL